jgi:membrane-associated protease RseP (regulator of RpoE activity)
MQARAIAAAAVLAAGAALGGAVLVRALGGSTEVGELRAQLDLERAARERLEAQLARIESDLARLREGTAVIDEADTAPYAKGAQAPEAGEVSAAAVAEEAGDAPSPGHAWFDARRLAAAGLPERDVAELHDLFEEVELDRLYLQNQAQREGWPRGRLATELAALDERLLSVRKDYGEEAYDWFLYAAGRSNRVVVEGVLGGSAAAEAGLRTGDVILSYDGERIFKPGTLVEGTLAGRLNETVEVVVLRGGERVEVTVPRGPLGLRLGKDNAEPTAPAE